MLEKQHDYEINFQIMEVNDVYDSWDEYLSRK